MTPRTRNKVLHVVAAGAALLLTAAPAAFAQSGTGGSEPTTGNRPSHTRPGAGTERGAKQGDVSRIRRAQEALKSEGHDPGPVDGRMGPKTQDALRHFQKQENLRETGRLDQETLSKLGV